MSSPVVTTQEVESVALLNLHKPAHVAIPLAQTKHRFDIISKWNIPAGSRVLELGCGQGDCTAVLAHIVGPKGHVTAIDPGPIDTYGKKDPIWLIAMHSYPFLNQGAPIHLPNANPISLLVCLGHA